jgi:hypothetical protein
MEPPVTVPHAEHGGVHGGANAQRAVLENVVQPIRHGGNLTRERRPETMETRWLLVCVQNQSNSRGA